MTLTKDAFLGGRLQIWQPAQGYRGGTDPVLLAAACPAREGESILDLGCGTGIAGLCLGARVAQIQLSGLEISPLHAALARRNSVENSIEFNIIEGDVASPPAALRTQSFDHVICNPPYFGPGTASPLASRDLARRGATDLGIWVDQALRRAGPKGSVTMITRTDRMAEVMGALTGRAGALVILPIAGRAGAEAGRIIIQAWKSRRTPPRLLSPLIMHQGSAHPKDAEHHTEAANALLRGAKPLILT